MSSARRSIISSRDDKRVFEMGIAVWEAPHLPFPLFSRVLYFLGVDQGLQRLIHPVLPKLICSNLDTYFYHRLQRECSLFSISREIATPCWLFLGVVRSRLTRYSATPPRRH